ncbi:MAG: deoxyribose-phosphate aldolase, partial [Lachnospiraceae bacterium]|nr:deoxyribose-phosphate aldolase [Lachnospiraceae bacterium]
TEDAVLNGADEIDMVINVGMVKAGDYKYVLDEIRQVRQACADKVLKAIIETCLLTDDEKIALCKVVSESGADFIKTSTGFSSGGATAADVALLRTYTDESVGVKAAGGISSIEDAEEFIKLGASRLGTSRIVKIVKKGL